MKHKIEAIDYLRGLSILMIILLHTIRLSFFEAPTAYSLNPSLSRVRDILNFTVVTIVFCSGFSLYYSYKNSTINSKNIMAYYKKRLKKLIIPYLIYIIGSSIFFLIIGFFSRQFIRGASTKFSLFNQFSIGNIPILWISFKWIVFLFVMLAIIFPILKYIYEKNKYSILVVSLLYIISSSLYKPINIYESSITFPAIVLMAISFVLGWSVIYLLGFYVESLYNNKKLIKKELKLTLNFIVLFLLIFIIYRFFNIDNRLYVNKIPPSPYYLSFGIAVTFLLLTLFYAYKHFIHEHLKKILSFFSSNSYWLFLWSYLSLVIFSYFFSFLTSINIYLLLVLEFITHCIFISILVFLQKKLIKIEMHLEKHHF